MIFKVCGMRDHANINELMTLQPDWMGLIFYDRSPRNVQDPIELHEISAKKIGVFVNAGNDFVNEKINIYNLDGLQFHGQESPATCLAFKEKGFIVIKAFAIDSSFDLSDLVPYEGSCNYYLFDTKGEKPGGTGKSFDWSAIQKYSLLTPFILSGGIGPESVDAINQFHHPKWAGIDINSRFEDKPGLKNIDKIQRFKHELFS